MNEDLFLRNTLAVIITLVLPSCSTVNSTIGTTDRLTPINHEFIRASARHQNAKSWLTRTYIHTYQQHITIIIL